MIKTRERRDLNQSIPWRRIGVPKSDPKGIAKSMFVQRLFWREILVTNLTKYGIRTHDDPILKMRWSYQLKQLKCYRLHYLFSEE